MSEEYPNCVVSTFSIKEKLFAQLTYNAGVIVAAYGLFLNHPSLAFSYLLYAYLGILLVVRYTICPRCPHLNLAVDCLQLPAFIMKRIISPKRKGPLSLPEKILLPIVLYGTFIFPLYWISSNRYILVLFILLFGGHLLGLQLHFCRNCENVNCIQNQKRNFIGTDPYEQS
jgi:hypothetical protein